MIDALPIKDGCTWVDLGCGTGENVTRLGDRIKHCSKIHLVDLCEPLLKVARSRVSSINSVPIEVHRCDATQFNPGHEIADVVTFSYSLTMIPDWFSAIDNAFNLLKPGGFIGVTDFFVSRKHADADETQHGWLTRTGWPIWFQMDNVYLEPDRFSMLKKRFESVKLSQHRGRIAYIPFFSVPYYYFIGRKPVSG